MKQSLVASGIKTVFRLHFIIQSAVDWVWPWEASWGPFLSP